MQTGCALASRATDSPTPSGARNHSTEMWRSGSVRLRLPSQEIQCEPLRQLRLLSEAQQPS